MCIIQMIKKSTNKPFIGKSFKKSDDNKNIREIKNTVKSVDRYIAERELTKKEKEKREIIKMTAVLEIKLKNLDKIQKETLKEQGITDEDCAKLLECSINKDCSMPSKTQGKTWACARPLPCTGNEKERVSHGRKWCSGRDKKQVEKKIAQTIYNMKKRQELRIKKVVKSNPTVVTEMKNVSSMVENIKPEIIEWEKRIENLSRTGEKTVSKNSLEKRMVDLFGLSSENEIKLILMDTVKESLGLVKQQIKNDPQNPQYVTPDNKKLSVSQDKTHDALDSISKAMSLITQEVNKVHKDNQEIKRQMNTVERAAKRTLGEEKWKELMSRYIKGGPKLLAKELVKTPLKLLKIIVIKPAWNGFMILFGNYAYKIWSILMLILVILVFISVSIVCKDTYPAIYNCIWNAAAYILTNLYNMGSISAFKLNELLGGAGAILYQNVKSYTKSYTISYITRLYDFILSYIDPRNYDYSFLFNKMWEHAPVPSISVPSMFSYFKFNDDYNYYKKMNKDQIQTTTLMLSFKDEKLKIKKNKKSVNKKLKRIRRRKNNKQIIL